MLETEKYSKKLIKDLTSKGQDNVLRTIRNAMVQIWEDIELADWQKQQEGETEIDGVKGIKKFYYLNDLIKKQEVV